MKILLEDVYKKIVIFLNKEKYEYIIIGGIAAGTLGEPRVTGDVDIDILLDRYEISDFLSKAKKAGFKFDRDKCILRAKETGVFQIGYGDFHIDLIIASIDLEREAIKRKRMIKLHKINAFFPTPEDLILLKIVPGRSQDLFDVEKIAIRYSGKLDRAYLENWARALSDEAHDMRIYNTLKKILEKR